MHDHSSMTTDVLLAAYATGYFPMGVPGTSELHWYNPDPRAIIPLEKFHISRSLRRELRKGDYEVTFNQAFLEVMKGCSLRAETWISEPIFDLYGQLFEQGNAGSVEIWVQGELVGGVYGVMLGAAFFGESMFHKRTNASKLALAHLVQRLIDHHFLLFEVQFLTSHLSSMGAIEVPKKEYLKSLRRALVFPTGTL